MAGYNEIALGQVSNNNFGGDIHSGVRIIPFSINRTSTQATLNFFITTVPIEDYHMLIAEYIASPALGNTSDNLISNLNNTIIFRGGTPKYVKNVQLWSKTSYLATNSLFLFNSYLGVDIEDINGGAVLPISNDGFSIFSISTPQIRFSLDPSDYSPDEVDIVANIDGSADFVFIRGTLTLM